MYKKNGFAALCFSRNAGFARALRQNAMQVETVRRDSWSLVHERRHVLRRIHVRLLYRAVVLDKAMRRHIERAYDPK